MLERCRGSGAAWAIAGSMLTAGACSESDPRPPPASDCNDPACIEARDNGIPQSSPVSSGVNGSAGAAGAAGGSGMPPAVGAGTLSGTVRQVTSEDLRSDQELQGTVHVRAPNARANEDDVDASTGAGGTFRLDGVQQGATTWVGVGAFEDPPSEVFIDTLQAVDSTRGNSVGLVVLRRAPLRDLAATSFLNGVLELDPLRAHVVIRFVKPNGSAAEGVHISFPQSDTASTAYDDGNTFSDSADETSRRGMAILLNLAAARFPGGVTTIVAQGDGDQITKPLQIAQGAVTLVTAEIPDP